MKRPLFSMFTLVGLTTALCAAAGRGVKADEITFNGLGSYSSLPSPYSLGGLTFQTGYYQYIWPGGAGPGADNGTDYLINGYSDETITATGGGSFTLNSFDLGLSYYTPTTSSETITFNYADGGSSSITPTLGQFYTPFTENLPPLSSVVFGPVNGYIALDNIVFNSAVPEPGAYALLGSLGLTGAAFLRRRRAR